MEHRSDVLRLSDLLLRLECATAHEAPAVGIKSLLKLHHLLHVRRRYLVVPGLPEDYGRRIAEVDDRVSHRLYALRPRTTRDVALLVARRSGAHDAELVERADGRGFRRDVHPADEICVRLADERGVIVLQPIRGNAYRGPLVSRPLCIASKPDILSVYEKPALRRVVLHFAETCANRLAV